MNPYKRFFSFGLVGTIGFLVDFGVLYVLKSVIDVYCSRIISFLTAALITWVLNKVITFRDRQSGRHGLREVVGYIIVMLIGGGFNYLIFVLLMLWVPLVSANPVLGVAAGSLAGMGFNYFSSGKLIFRVNRS